MEIMPSWLQSRVHIIHWSNLNYSFILKTALNLHTYICPYNLFVSTDRFKQVSQPILDGLLSGQLLFLVFGSFLLLETLTQFLPWPFGLGDCYCTSNAFMFVIKNAYFTQNKPQFWHHLQSIWYFINEIMTDIKIFKIFTLHNFIWNPLQLITREPKSFQLAENTNRQGYIFYHIMLRMQVLNYTIDTLLFTLHNGRWHHYCEISWPLIAKWSNNSYSTLPD